MKEERQRKILEIISRKRVTTQQQLAVELGRLKMATTQSSVSRDVEEMGLTKLNGAYVAPQHALEPEGLGISLDMAGNNLIVVRTLVGQAQPTALRIDGARFPEIVGTVAGDDTIFVAVRNGAAQRLAVHKIVRLFAGKGEND